MLEKFKRILLVDDDDMVNSINKIIIKHAKFAEEVISCTNAPEAINFLFRAINEEALPEVIFLDQNMPDMNGWDFINEFSKLKLQKNVKVIMLTSSISEKDKKRASTVEDITTFISKPLSPELLEATYEIHLS